MSADTYTIYRVTKSPRRRAVVRRGLAWEDVGTVWNALNQPWALKRDWLEVVRDGERIVYTGDGGAYATTKPMV